ncbi:MAG: ribosomal protein [Candidatus Peribacteria bacterium]|nr:ribosomal protein [Candidatus Peribacteria bacterium]
MDIIPLTVTARDTSKSPKQLRKAGHIPCVVYGNSVTNTPIQCEMKLLHKTFAKAGESTLVELQMDGQKIPVLFKAISFHPVSSHAMHADFYAVNMKEEIETTVPVRFEGEAPAVKDLGGIFIASQEEVTVRCLPANLPHELVVDISTLTELHTSVYVSDIKLPKGVEVTDDAEAVLATVQEARAEEVEPEVVADAAAVPAEGAPAAGSEPKEAE